MHKKSSFLLFMNLIFWGVCVEAAAYRHVPEDDEKASWSSFKKTVMGIVLPEQPIVIPEFNPVLDNPNLEQRKVALSWRKRGISFLRGDLNCKKDINQALYWLNLAAQLGYRAACWDLYAIFQYGQEGVSENVELAARYLANRRWDELSIEPHPFNPQALESAAERRPSGDSDGVSKGGTGEAGKVPTSALHYRGMGDTPVTSGGVHAAARKESTLMIDAAHPKKEK